MWAQRCLCDTPCVGAARFAWCLTCHRGPQCLRNNAMLYTHHLFERRCHWCGRHIFPALDRVHIMALCHRCVDDPLIGRRLRKDSQLQPLVVLSQTSMALGLPGVLPAIAQCLRGGPREIARGSRYLYVKWVLDPGTWSESPRFYRLGRDRPAASTGLRDQHSVLDYLLSFVDLAELGKSATVRRG